MSKPSKIEIKPHPVPIKISTKVKKSTGARPSRSKSRQIHEKAGKPLTTVQKPKTSDEQRALLFIEAYIANGNNGTKAAIAAGFSQNGADVQACRMLVKPKIGAGFSEKSASSQGHDLLKHPEVFALISARQQELADFRSFQNLSLGHADNRHQKHLTVYLTVYFK